MNKIIYLIFASIMLICCKEKENDHNSIEVNKKENNSKVVHDENVESEWLLYSISESPIVNLNKTTRAEIVQEFKKVKIHIKTSYFEVGNLCSFEFYKTTKMPLEYWHSQSTINIFSQELSQTGVALKDSLIIYQALYPEKSCKNPASEYFITDSTLVFSYNGYLILFQQQPKLYLSTKELNNNCYSNTKITSLPMTKEKLSTQIWNELGCSISNLNSNMYIRLPDIGNVLVFVIADFNGDDEFYTLITMINDKIIAQKKIGFANELHEGGRSVTGFEIDRDYTFILTTNERMSGIWKTTKKEQYTINDSGGFNIVL